MSSENERKIHSMIVGAQKCGTTSLKKYLQAHPSIDSHPQIELTFFWDKKEYQQGTSFLHDKYFSQVDYSAGSPLLLGKHATLMRSGQALERLFRHNPECKIIVSLRDPVDRAYSSFLHQQRRKQKSEDFLNTIEKAISNHDQGINDWKYNIYLGLGIYHLQIQELYRIFGSEKVYLMLMEEWKTAPAKIIHQIFEFLEVDPDFIPDLDKKHNAAVKPRSGLYATFLSRLVYQDNPIKRILKSIIPSHSIAKMGNWARSINEEEYSPPPISDEAREKLVSFYYPYNQYLKELIALPLEDYWKGMK